MSRLLPIALALLLLAQIATTKVHSLPSLAKRWPFRRRGNNKYTPLVFLTVPPGLIPECDAMEKVVCQVERELGVEVARLDVLRNPANEAVLDALVESSGTTPTPPLLYHRESGQKIHILPSSNKKNPSSNAGGKTKTTQWIDPDRVRAWAKGRVATSPLHTDIDSTSISGKRTQAPPGSVNDSGNEDDNDDSDAALLVEQAEQLADLTLTPQQRLGKQRMQERTNAKQHQQ